MWGGGGGGERNVPRFVESMGRMRWDATSCGGLGKMALFSPLTGGPPTPFESQLMCVSHTHRGREKEREEEEEEDANVVAGATAEAAFGAAPK